MVITIFVAEGILIKSMEFLQEFFFQIFPVSFCHLLVNTILNQKNSGSENNKEEKQKKCVNTELGEEDKDADGKSDEFGKYHKHCGPVCANPFTEFGNDGEQPVGDVDKPVSHNLQIRESQFADFVDHSQPQSGDLIEPANISACRRPNCGVHEHHDNAQ